MLRRSARKGKIPLSRQDLVAASVIKANNNYRTQPASTVFSKYKSTPSFTYGIGKNGAISAVHTSAVPVVTRGQSPPIQSSSFLSQEQAGNNLINMDCYEEIAFESKAYTSTWLIQNLIKECKNENVLQSGYIPEIDYVLQSPHIFVVGNRQSSDVIADSKLLVRGNFKGIPIPESKKETLSSNQKRPFAVVFMLRVEGRHGNCFLNADDCMMLDKAKRFIHQMEDIVYILKYDAGAKARYDETDLLMVSEEITNLIYGKNSQNRIFPKLFFMHDEQIHIRIGLCLHKSILCHTKQIFSKLERVRQKIETDLTKLQAFGNEFMTKLNLPLYGEFRYNIFETRRNVVNDFISDVIWFGLRKRFTCQTRDILLKFFIQMIRHYPRYMTRSKARWLKCYGASAKGKRKSKGTRSKAVDVNAWQKKIMSIEKTNFRRSLINKILQSVKQIKDNLSGLCQNILDEFTKRGDNVALHEFKIVSERNPQIKGFGYAVDRITININKDDESCKKEVSKYLKKYLDVKGYTVSIQCKKRTFTPFSNLEQGSRINRANTEKYGTLGMFFQGDQDTYFFTTCAHVIGENAIAYSHTDNTRIGKNVFVFDSGSGMGDSQETHMDFSLIEVSPERNLTCTFGLKTLTGNFIEGHIFQGDLSEIRHRTLYKWGATKPYFRKGKCLGYDSDGAVLILQIDTPQFAGPGDSGAIICIGDDPKLGLAAFVLVGGGIDDETGIATYAVYKVSEAIDKVSELRREITPCLIPCQKSINISESTRTSPPKAQKRKVEDDQSGSGQKRWSSSKFD